MTVEVFANQPSTTVSSGGTDAPSSGTSQMWTVASSTSFPAANSGASPPTQFHICDTASGKTSEIIAVTNVSGTTWTVTRGAESTTPVAHSAGFAIQQVVTAGVLGGLPPAPSAANQYPVSNSSDQWVLSQVGTVGGNTYNTGWTVATGDLGGEALYSSSSGGSATVPSGLTSVVGASLALRQLGTGALTVAGGSGVTIEGTPMTTGQYQALFARQVATNTWAVTASQPTNSPAFTGTPTVPTASALTDDTQIATTAYADSAVAVETSRAETAEALKAPLASPALTGSPTAPTQSGSDTSTKLATTAYVTGAVHSLDGGVPSLMPALMPSGALAENFPRIFSTGNDTSLSTGVPFLCYGPYVLAGVSYGHINFYISGNAASGQNHAWLALLSPAGTVLAVTADAGSSALGGGGTFTFVGVAFASAWTPATSQQTIAAVCVTASGIPSLRGINNASLGAATPILAGNSAGGSQATPPSVSGTVTLASAPVSVAPYFYLSA